MKKSAAGSLEDRLSQFLLLYRLTPYATTGIAPAQLLTGRQLCSRSDLVRPGVDSKAQQKQERQKANSAHQQKLRTFSVDDPVFVLHFPTKDAWLPGTIRRLLDSRAYEICLDNTRIVRRHVDHIRTRLTTGTDSCDLSLLPELPDVPTSTPASSSPPPVLQPETEPVSESTAPPRRSTQISVPPDRFIDQYS